MRKILAILLLASLVVRVSFFVVPLVLPFVTHAAPCGGASPTWTAASPALADVQACLNETLACGDTIIVPHGSATYTAQLASATLPSGCASNQGITIQFATACSAGCSPGSEGVGLAFADNSATCSSVGTCITLSNASGSSIFMGPSSNTSFVTLANVTFIYGVAQSNGQVAFQGTHASPGCGSACASFRLHNVHIVDAVGNGVHVFAYDGYGLEDHILDENTANPAGGPLAMGGDLPTAGGQNWLDTTNPGTAESIIVEDSKFTFTSASGDGLFDCYYGAKLTFRHNQASGFNGMGCHGTDSGFERSGVLMEVYNNNLACGGTGDLMNTRGGVVIYQNNVVTGTCAAIDLQYFRILGQNHSASWGTAGAGINWTPISNVQTAALSSVVTLGAPDWQMSHAYTCSSGTPCFIGPLLNNAGTGVTSAGGFNYESTSNCTSGGTEPNPWNQTFPAGTQSDGSCTWTNIGGGTAAGPGGSGFQAANPDTTCNSGGGCTRFFDTNGGVYPFRDQPGLVHNQVVYGNFQCNNSGAGLPSPVFITDSATSAVIVSGRDFFNGTCSPDTFYTYPDPLQGAVARPAAPCRQCFVKQSWEEKLWALLSL